ncbi:MAG: hydrogenase maturation nickel metallochaperone HypA, partial [Candidatus Neomarinimicrobiota bacterium]
RVKDIFVEVGALAGVMIPPLEFNLDIAKQHTCARDAVIHIQELEGRGRCPACGDTFPMSLPFEPCPQCNGSYLTMIAGNMLRVREIEVEKTA